MDAHNDSPSSRPVRCDLRACAGSHAPVGAQQSGVNLRKAQADSTIAGLRSQASRNGMTSEGFPRLPLGREVRKVPPGTPCDWRRISSSHWGGLGGSPGGGDCGLAHAEFGHYLRLGRAVRRLAAAHVG